MIPGAINYTTDTWVVGAVALLPIGWDDSPTHVGFYKCVDYGDGLIAWDHIGSTIPVQALAGMSA